MEDTLTSNENLPSTALSNLSAGPPKDPITCHVLDLVTGRPAPHLAVSLTLVGPLGPSAPFKALTNADGRIMHWQGLDGPSLQAVFEQSAEHADSKMIWALKFETGAYYGEGNTFFPEVEVHFFVSPKEGHYHVPLLLGPWSYTTYRGS